MVNRMEREHLIQMYGEPSKILPLILKCAACILMVLLLAVVGAGRDGVGQTNGTAGSDRESTATPQPASTIHVVAKAP